MLSNIPLASGEELDLAGDFGEAYKQINSTPDNYFITGKAGTGKSTLLRYFVENTNKRVALLAPTGLAAVNIQGQTIHSFFQFPPEPITRHHIQFNRKRELYKPLETIVIDEVSMVRADMMDGIDQMLRLNRGRPKDPFGGIQMLLFGDIFQLQPVVASKEETKYFSSYYESPYFFDAKVFKQARFLVIDLQKVFRQKDRAFIDLLDAVRMNKLDADQYNLLNSRFMHGFRPHASSSFIVLTSTNKIAGDINDAHLHEIKEPKFTFYGDLEGEFPKRSLPTEMVLTLRKGAQVMFVKNAMDGSWVNGTIGKVVEIDDDHIAVQVREDGGEYTYGVPLATWEVRKHKLDPVSGTISTEIVGRFTQYPLKLAWAITIHKSQGLTFNLVAIDLGRGAFAHGQTYVALSRCTSFDGLFLRSKLRRSDMIVDHAVKHFYDERIINTSMARNGKGTKGLT